MEAKRDQNKVPALLAVSNADGETTLSVYADSDTNSLIVDNGTSGSDLSDAPAKRDQNKVPALMAVSEADGVTPVPIYANSVTNGVLIDSN